MAFSMMLIMRERQKRPRSKSPENSPAATSSPPSIEPAKANPEPESAEQSLSPAPKVEKEAYLEIFGDHALHGEVRVQGGKNAALPLIAASLLCSAPVTLRNVPRISDVEGLLELMKRLGTRVRWTQGLNGDSLELHTPEITNTQVGAGSGIGLRASFNLMGPLVARAGEARVELPGGCTFQDRPVDQHLKALQSLGYTIKEDAGAYLVQRPPMVRGKNPSAFFDLPTVGGTQNALCAAAMHAQASIDNASIDPDALVVAHFLTRIGVRLSGLGTPQLELQGIGRPCNKPVAFDVPGDRLEAGTLLLMGAATRGEVSVKGIEIALMRPLIAKLKEWGAQTSSVGRMQVRVHQTGEMKASGLLTACEFPGFPTDLQPIAVAAACALSGELVVRDRIYPLRQSHLAPLRRMGAEIDVAGDVQVVRQKKRLQGNHVEGLDIRATSALILAGLAAPGETRVTGLPYLSRGHEDLVGKLKQLGARIISNEPEHLNA